MRRTFHLHLHRSASPAVTQPARGDVVGAFRFQARSCAEHGAPTYARVLEAAAEDCEHGGPVRWVVAPYADDPFESALALRLLGAVHRMVLAGRLPALASTYPSAGGDARLDPAAPFLAAVAMHAETLRAEVAVPVQTNEPARSAALAPALHGLAAAHRKPLRVLEIGASAGLNLRFDAYRYEPGADRPGGVRGDRAGLGPVDSPVRFVDAWEGAWPFPTAGTLPDPLVVERAGCDRSPLDPHDPAHRLALRGWVWPDHTDRLARLDAALAVAGAVPAPVDRADAGAWLDARLAVPVPGVVTVVVHSIVWQYLGAEGRRAVRRAVERAGRAASAEAPVAWLRMEPGAATDRAELRCTTWPGGRDVLLGRPSFHGVPVSWSVR